MKAVPMTIEDHVCSMCFARIVSFKADDGGNVYVCMTCGRRQAGRGPEVLCSCGAKTPKGKDLGFRCVPNLEKTNDCPFEIVAKQI